MDVIVCAIPRLILAVNNKRAYFWGGKTRLFLKKRSRKTRLAILYNLRYRSDPKYNCSQSYSNLAPCLDTHVYRVLNLVHVQLYSCM
jgi:hypothetical protein